MPISQFTIGSSRTINLGNFESLRVEASVTWEIPEHYRKDADGINGEHMAAQEQLRKLLEETYKRMTKKKEIAHEPA